MRILVTKDASTKVSREVADLAEARAIAAMGFHVEQIDEHGGVGPLPPEEQPPVDDAFVAVGSTRFSDGQAQTDASLAKAQAAFAGKAKAPAKKAAPAKKSAPAKKAPAKKGAAKRR